MARSRRNLRHGPESRGKYLVGGAVLNLTGPPQPDTLDMRVPGLGDAGCWFRPVRRTLREEDAAATLVAIARGQVARCILPWIPLMRGAGEASIIEEWKRLAQEEPKGEWRSEYGVLASTFAELTPWMAQWKQALKEWEMKEAQLLSQFQTEGKLMAMRANLLRLLELRCKKPVPADLAAAIEAKTDMDELARWFDAAVACTSYKAFREAVQANGSSS
jgi:hypothetical protein